MERYQKRIEEKIKKKATEEAAKKVHESRSRTQEDLDMKAIWGMPIWRTTIDWLLIVM